MAANSTDSMKVPRNIARVISAIIVGFAVFMFIGESMESAQRANPEPMSLYSMIQLAIFGIGLLGLALAWKWELVGGIISLLAFITLFIVNTEALVWVMFIFPVNSILFLGVGYQSRGPK